MSPSYMDIERGYLYLNMNTIRAAGTGQGYFYRGGGAKGALASLEF